MLIIDAHVKYFKPFLPTKCKNLDTQFYQRAEINMGSHPRAAHKENHGYEVALRSWRQ